MKLDANYQAVTTVVRPWARMGSLQPRTSVRPPWTIGLGFRPGLEDVRPV